MPEERRDWAANGAAGPDLRALRIRGHHDCELEAQLVERQAAGDPEAGRQLAGDFNAVGRQLRQHTTTHLV